MSKTVIKTDVALVGAGIMSATLGALLRQLQPDWSISLFERLDAAAGESSDPWNNAGTGHSALCELNYTPKTADGDVDITKALNINEQFQVSRQFWAHAVDNGILGDPSEFINPIPHVAFTHGDEGVKYLRKRYDNLAGQTLFEGGMEFIDDPAEFTKRLPLMSDGRDFADPVALNWFDQGTDVDFGALTQQLLNYVAQGADIYFGHSVTNLSKQSDGSWIVKVRNGRTGDVLKVHAKFVFVGAGGGALHLLQKSGIKEAKGFGGFPVSGEFFRCTNPTSSANTSQGLRPGRRRRAADVGAAPRHPRDQPQAGSAVRPVRRLVAEVPQVGQDHRPARIDQTRQPPAHGVDRAAGVRPAQVPHRRARREQGRSRQHAVGVRAPCARSGLGAHHRRPARAGHPQDGCRRQARVRYRRRDLRGRHHVRPARRIPPGCLDRGPGDAVRAREVLPVGVRSWSSKLTEIIPSFGKKLNGDRDLYRQVWDWTNKSLRLTGRDASTVEADALAPPATAG